MHARVHRKPTVNIVCMSRNLSRGIVESCGVMHTGTSYLVMCDENLQKETTVFINLRTENIVSLHDVKLLASGNVQIQASKDTVECCLRNGYTTVFMMKAFLVYHAL